MKERLQDVIEWIVLFDEISIFPHLFFLEMINHFYEAYFPARLKWAARREAELYSPREGVLGRVTNMVFYMLHVLQLYFQNEQYIQPAKAGTFQILDIYTLMEKLYIEESLKLETRIRELRRQ
jgi:hypothetical protein